MQQNRLSNDPDNTLISRKYYEESYGKYLSASFDDFDGTIRNYRGETIISFNTMIGFLIVLLPINSYGLKNLNQKERLKLVLNANTVDKEIKDSVNEFYYIYHTKANFMPLPQDVWMPNNTPVIDLKNLNQIKGSFKKYYDFPDEFFSDVRKVVEKEEQIADVSGFYTEINSSYFQIYKANWENYVEWNYLQPFFVDDEYRIPVNLAPGNTFPRNWTELNNLNHEQKQKCIDEIQDFWKNAIKIIKARGQLLLDKDTKSI